MFFDITLYFAFLIFLFGLIYRVSLWFKTDFSSDEKKLSSSTKAGAVIITILKTVFSVKIFLFLYSFIVDGLLQIRVLKSGFLRWFMHFSIFAGFMLLVIFHVFDETITASLFIDYASTLNPFMFLRNLLGLLVVLGLVIAVWRRFLSGTHKAGTNQADYIALILTAVIIISGFLLESAKIVSEPVFDRMIEEYSDIEDEDELAALRVYWAEEFDVVFQVLPEEVDEEMLEAGLDLHEDTCASCHTKPAAAFVSFPIMKVIKPFALSLNDIRADLILLYIHYLSSFLALALLPFTKAFHLISTPLSMSLNRLSTDAGADSKAKSVKRMIELDACVHCGSCTDVCSVGPIFNVIANDNILPSEKIGAIGEFVKGNTNFRTNNLLLEGSVICTDCFRCNDICPAGIDLRDIWNTSKDKLKRIGYVQPGDLVKQKTMDEWSGFFKKEKSEETPVETSENSIVKIIDNPEFFSNCIQCTTCANVCPVVENSDGTSHDAGMSPQQVMNFLRLEMKDMALVSGLVWNCVTCYMCQEHCPREIPVADIIAEFRTQGFVKLNSLAMSGEVQE